MKVLVTGASGFIGTHVSEALETHGVDVIRVDKRTGEDLSSFSLTSAVFDSVIRIDAVIHLAASCSTSGSMTDPMQTYQDTVGTAVNVIEQCRVRGIPLIVTTSVKARDAHTPYGAAKRIVETWAWEYRQAYGLRVLVNRPGTIYGPGQEGSPESGWVAWFCKARDEKLPVTISGDGSQVRDLLHVDDYVALLLRQLTYFDQYSTQDRIFDVGGGCQNAVTVKELADHLGVEYAFGPRRYGDSLCYVGLNDAPDWHPIISWRESEMLA